MTWWLFSCLWWLVEKASQWTLSSDYCVKSADEESERRHESAAKRNICLVSLLVWCPVFVLSVKPQNWFSSLLSHPFQTVFCSSRSTACVYTFKNFVFRFETQVSYWQLVLEENETVCKMFRKIWFQQWRLQMYSLSVDVVSSGGFHTMNREFNSKSKNW